VFLGADDAASACGAILEIAAILAQGEPDLARQVELVFFDGEEAFGDSITLFDGLYGSRFYATEWRTRPDKPEFGIVLDMIGHKDLRIELPSDTPEDLRDAVLAAAKAERAAGHFAIAPGSFLDDHVPLIMAGIPTVDIIGRFAVGAEPSGKPIHVPWWHTTGDSLELISVESLDISIRVTLRVLREKLGK
jgi:Zn-dependent M28 family amino/carboxypeptidase